ncbi:MAG: hypothetical protein ACO2ZT_06280 [Pontimonas sp.]
MSEWNYTKCAKPFESEAEAREYMESNDFAGYILRRDNGYTAVCLTYPDGYYPDGVKIAEIDNSKAELLAHLRELPVNCC